MLQSNGEVAIRHCYHGLMLFNSANAPEWALHYLLPIFRRLSILPFYFGDSQPLTDYSHLTQPNPSITDSFTTAFQAQESIDAIYNLTIQLFRQTGEYRLGKARMQPVEPAILLEQDTIHQYLAQWRASFDKFESKTYFIMSMASELSRIWMFQQYEVCTILSNLLFVTDETDYDRFIPNFKRMVKGARKLANQRKRSARSDFHFEMGFSPFLFLVGIKCRCLETRIEALRLMGILGAAQESLWDTYALQVVAQRVIDLEHGVVAQVEGQKTTPKYNSLPPDEVRVRHFVLGSSDSSSEEKGVAGKEITFYMPTEEGGIHLRRERLSTERFNDALAAAPGIFNIDLGRGSASPTRREDSEKIYVMR
ncbi:hypothetical protein FSARC_10733 [Fusarium sarcochroum]|uniref:Uncharacterized protein n=1 Tax=Fusarium sarcochroum TaxID=1208366 RepID=A0A8H4TK70_9HYPO|nr:hypothetical protein FSARC_10733 [Fusarium sarcochroum]